MRKIMTAGLLLVSTWLALQIGSAIPLLGSSISAIIIGAIIRHTPLFKELDSQITGFVSKYLLKAGIVLLGFTLSFRIVSEVGLEVLLVLAAEIIASITIAVVANKYLKMDNTLALLVGIGTSICGGSAIVATAPILEAENEDIAVSVTTMFIYSMLALLLLPIIGQVLGYNDQLYGILAGAAVNDTASVVATAFDWSDSAGKVATVVKLVRTLYIVPVTLGAIYFKLKAQNKGNQGQKNKIDFQQIIKTIPGFVVLFVGAVIVASIFTIPADITKNISTISKLMMTLALITIGLGVHVKQIQEAGIKPVLMGAMCWAGVLIASVASIALLY
ncbi:YeiH family protein [Hutsoniella sourekii]